MTAACTTYTHSRGLLEPFMMDRSKPGSSEALEGDVSKDIDCESAGVTLTSVTAAIRAEDDDGLLTLGTVTFDAAALTFRVPYTVDLTAPDKIYGVIVTVATSDLRSGLDFEYAVQVRGTRYAWG